MVRVVVMTIRMISAIAVASVATAEDVLAAIVRNGIPAAASPDFARVAVAAVEPSPCI